MDEPYRAGPDVHVLPSQMIVPGVGSIPIHAFVLLSEHPVLIDCGMAVDGPAFVDALRTIIDPAELRWIWLTHDDADHTGSLPALMELAPQAMLATHGLGALRMHTWWPLPLDRVHALAPGDGLDAGDRVLRAVRPPTYDNPMSTGLFDESTSTLFSVDSFGAILSAPQHDVADLSDEELQLGMQAWATFDSPWLHLTDRDRLAAVLDEVRRLRPERVLSSHLPPATGRIESLLEAVAAIRDAPPFVAPDAAAFDAIVAGSPQP